MPAGFRLKNLPVSALPTHVRENAVARSLCRQYTGNLLARTVWRQARQAAQRLLDRQLLDMPRLRLMSGEEIVVEIPNNCSTHDFYQLSRATLNLGRSTSLALLRMGPGSVEHPLLPCVRWESSHLIKRRVFQVVTHK